MLGARGKTRGTLVLDARPRFSFNVSFRYFKRHVIRRDVIRANALLKKATVFMFLSSRIRCEHEVYTIWLGDNMICEFKHRLKSSNIDTLKISGDIVLYQLAMTQAA